MRASTIWKVVKKDYLEPGSEKFNKVVYEIVKADKKKTVMLITDPKNTYTLIYDTPWIVANFVKKSRRLTQHGMRLLVDDAQMAYDNIKGTEVGKAYGN